MSDEREFNIDDILSEFKYNKVVNPEADLSMDELRQKLDRINAIDINLDDLNEQQSFMVEDDGGFKVDLNWVEKPEMTKKQETQDIEDAVVETVETMTQDEDFVEEIIYPKQQVEENSTQTVEENTTATVEEEADVASVIAEEVKTIELEDRAEKSKFDDARFKGFFGKNATEDTVRKEPKPKKIKKPKPTLEEDKIEITDENIVELISKKTAESKTWFIRTLIVLAISIPMTPSFCFNYKIIIERMFE